MVTVQAQGNIHGLHLGQTATVDHSTTVDKLISQGWLKVISETVPEPPVVVDEPAAPEPAPVPEPIPEPVETPVQPAPPASPVIKTPAPRRHRLV
jgi:outer membrane biosynthesis protein TonB